MKDRHPHSLASEPRYRTFVTARDKALVRLHDHAQRDISVILHEALTRVLEIIGHHYSKMADTGSFFSKTDHNLTVIDQRILYAFHDAGLKILNRVYLLRRRSYLLATTAEGEAIGQATGKGHTIRIPRSQLDGVMRSRTPRDEDIQRRIQLSFSRLRRDIMDALELARVMEESVQDASKRALAMFPKVSAYRRPQRILARLARESDQPTRRPATVTQVDDDEWHDMVQDYLDDRVPVIRFYNDPISDPEAEKRYTWEIEQEVTHDFAHQVREGQIEGARQSGITDLVWIAVLDNATDACCIWRDGLTTAEIRTKLQGEHADDDCDADTPPAHFNCRCALAPVSDVPEQIEPNLEDFDEWLNS